MSSLVLASSSMPRSLRTLGRVSVCVSVVVAMLLVEKRVKATRSSKMECKAEWAGAWDGSEFTDTSAFTEPELCDLPICDHETMRATTE